MQGGTGTMYALGYIGTFLGLSAKFRINKHFIGYNSYENVDTEVKTTTELMVIALLEAARRSLIFLST